jgi:iron complex transport system substrate-binding protein
MILTLQAAGMPVLVIEPKNLETTYDTIRMIGRVTGRTSNAADMINGLRRRFTAIEKTVSVASSITRVLVMYDVSPIYTSGPGTLTDDMIRIAGGQNIAQSNDPVDPESVIQSQPDVIICAQDLEPRIEQIPAWKGTVPAVTHTAYFHCSDKASLIRAGARLAAGAEELSRYLHPELYTSDGKPASHVVSTASKN